MRLTWSSPFGACHWRIPGDAWWDLQHLLRAALQTGPGAERHMSRTQPAGCDLQTKLLCVRWMWLMSSVRMCRIYVIVWYMMIRMIICDKVGHPDIPYSLTTDNLHECHWQRIRCIRSTEVDLETSTLCSPLSGRLAGDVTVATVVMFHPEGCDIPCVDPCDCSPGVTWIGRIAKIHCPCRWVLKLRSTSSFEDHQCSCSHWFFRCFLSFRYLWCGAFTIHLPFIYHSFTIHLHCQVMKRDPMDSIVPLVMWER